MVDFDLLDHARLWYARLHRDINVLHLLDPTRICKPGFGFSVCTAYDNMIISDFHSTYICGAFDLLCFWASVFLCFCASVSTAVYHFFYKTVWLRKTSKDNTRTERIIMKQSHQIFIIKLCKHCIILLKSITDTLRENWIYNSISILS